MRAVVALTAVWKACPAGPRARKRGVGCVSADARCDAPILHGRRRAGSPRRRGVRSGNGQDSPIGRALHEPISSPSPRGDKTIKLTSQLTTGLKLEISRFPRRRKLWREAARGFWRGSIRERSRTAGCARRGRTRLQPSERNERAPARAVASLGAAGSPWASPATRSAATRPGTASEDVRRRLRRAAPHQADKPGRIDDPPEGRLTPTLFVLMGEASRRNLFASIGR